MNALRIHSSAHKHGLTENEIRHAWHNALGYFTIDPDTEPPKNLCISSPVFRCPLRSPAPVSAGHRSVDIVYQIGTLRRWSGRPIRRRRSRRRAVKLSKRAWS